MVFDPRDDGIAAVVERDLRLIGVAPGARDRPSPGVKAASGARVESAIWVPLRAFPPCWRQASSAVPLAEAISAAVDHVLPAERLLGSPRT